MSYRWYVAEDENDETFAASTNASGSMSGSTISFPADGRRCPIRQRRVRIDAHQLGSIGS